MKRVMDVYFRTTGDYEIREDTFNGDAYIAVPVTMMLEGVHNGSHGSILHTASELEKALPSWNNIPVTIGHPKVDGNFVSANTPEILTEWSTGLVFNAHMDDEKLRAEAWINVEDITSMNPALLQRIQDNEEIEVSVGVFSDENVIAGQHRGENYVAVAYNHRPDHLALLPDEVGACSLEDGCGIRVNKSVSEMSKEKFILNSENRNVVLKELNKEGLSVFETGYNDLASKARDAVYAKDGNGFSYYLDEMFNDYLVYREHNYSGDAPQTKLYKQTYQENAAGEVELTGEAVQVKREVSYADVPQTNASKEEPVKRRRTKFNNNQKGEQGMPKDCKVCKDKATALIANTSNPFTEDHREMLEGMTVEQLDQLTPTVVEKETPAVVTNEQIMSAFQEGIKTPEDFLKLVPKGMRDQFQSGLDMQTNATNKMVEAIMANTEDVWTKEELETMPHTSVTKIYKSVVSAAAEDDVTVFLGDTSIPQTNKEDEVQVMPRMGVTFKKQA